METTYFNPSGFTVRYGFPAYRVFIFGQEVTADVLSVNIQWSVGLQPGTCQITMANKNYRYNITHNDMLQIAKYRDVPTEKLERLVDNTMPYALQVPPSDVLGRTDDYVAFNPLGNDDEAHDPTGSARNLKQNVVSAKIFAGDMNIPAGLSGEEVTDGKTVTNLPTPAYRYHFQVGKYIFHAMDPVRVFERDPYDPSIWYYMFSGFVSDMTSTREASGDSTFSVMAEQPSKWLRYARFSSNPGFTDISQVAVRAGIQQDVSFYSPFKVPIANLTLPEIVYAMMFGINAFGPNTKAQFLPSPSLRFGALDINNSVVGAPGAEWETPDMVSEDVYSANGRSFVSKRKWGIGHIKLEGSQIFVYGPLPASGTGGDAAPSTSDGGLPLAMGKPILISQTPGASLETYQQYIDNVVKKEDLKDLQTNTNNGAEFTATDATTIQDVIKIIGQRPDVYPVDGGRLFMLLPRDVAGQNAALSSIEFIDTFATITTWASRADILSEILERIEFTWYVTPKGDYVVEFPLYDFDTEDFGAFGPSWDIPLPETISIGTTFSDSKLYTQAVAYPEAIQNFKTQVSKELGMNQSVILWHLIGTYGVRQVPIQPRGYLASNAGARYYAQVCMNRLNANAFSQTASIVPNLRVWLNRPVKMNIIDHYGTSQSISHNITWGQSGDMTTTLDLSYMRGWDGTIDNDTSRKQYYTVGGVMGRPLNYSLMFKPNNNLAVPIPANSNPSPVTRKPIDRTGADLLPPGTTLEDFNVGVFPLPPPPKR